MWVSVRTMPGSSAMCWVTDGGECVEVGHPDHRDEVGRAGGRVDLGDPLGVGEGPAEAADRPRLADDEEERGQHSGDGTHPPCRPLETARPGRARPPDAAVDSGHTERDEMRRSRPVGSIMRCVMPDQLVCTSCWKWYDGRTVCPTCKVPLVSPDTGQAAPRARSSARRDAGGRVDPPGGRAARSPRLPERPSSRPRCRGCPATRPGRR